MLEPQGQAEGSHERSSTTADIGRAPSPASNSNLKVVMGIVRRLFWSVAGAVLRTSGLMLMTPVSALAQVCGFYTSGTFFVEAYYRHCAPSGRVIIQVSSATSGQRCVPSGVTFPGRVNAYPFVSNAYYIGRTC